MRRITIFSDYGPFSIVPVVKPMLEIGLCAYITENVVAEVKLVSIGMKFDRNFEVITKATTAAFENTFHVMGSDGALPLKTIRGHGPFGIVPDMETMLEIGLCAYANDEVLFQLPSGLFGQPAIVSLKNNTRPDGAMPLKIILKHGPFSMLN